MCGNSLSKWDAFVSGPLHSEGIGLFESGPFWLSFPQIWRQKCPNPSFNISGEHQEFADSGSLFAGGHDYRY